MTSRRSAAWKRCFDVALSSVGLIATSPILGAACLAIWLEDRRSPFYVAPRVGRQGEMFSVVKLRSMVVDADRSGVDSTSANDRRITRVGAVVRKYKLDELPQLWNVLRGDMSVVGPRPNVPREVDLYTPEERRLLDVRPGITDVASIVFADEGSILAGSDDPDIDYNQLIRPWKNRLALTYLDHQNVRDDLRLVLITVVALVSRRRALDQVQRLLARYAVDDALRSVAARRSPLRPAPPPGSAEIVTSRASASP